jgi:hypothetical protein
LDLDIVSPKAGMLRRNRRRNMCGNNFAPHEVFLKKLFLQVLPPSSQI